MIFIIISIITGTFTQLFMLLTIVFVHEIGHLLAALYFKWRIHSIVLWVFGGVMKTDESGNRTIREDIIVTVAGPLQHLFIYLMIIFLSVFHILPQALIQQALFYNTMILLFNLLPIYPLDGGKLLFYILSYILPFRKAHHYTILFSITVCICVIILQLFVLSFTLSAFLLIIFLLMENRTEWKNQYYFFIRFLLNRFSDPPSEFSKEQLIVPGQFKLMDVFSLFKRNRTYNIIVDEQHNQKYLTEQQSLYLYFKEKKLAETIGEIVQNS